MSKEWYSNWEIDDVIVCPYCGKKYEPTYEETYIGGEDVNCYEEGEIGEFSCNKCGKKFRLSAEMKLEYTTETIDGEMTEEEWETMMKEGVTMDYQKIKHIITNIDDPFITEKDKRSAIRSICNGNIDYLTVQDLQRAISWLYTDASFTINLKNINIKSLENRLKHLLQSEFIRSFDEVSYPSGTYKRDIKEADIQGDIMKKLVEVLPDLINSIVENVPVVVEKIIEKLPDAYLNDPDN